MKFQIDHKVFQLGFHFQITYKMNIFDISKLNNIFSFYYI